MLSDKGARLSGKCAVGDELVSIGYVSPQSADHMHKLARGPEGSLLDLELRQRGLEDTCTLQILRCGTPGAQPPTPYILNPKP